MPARQDYRIRQVASRANVSERTARRWRDTGDERWNRYLENDSPPFQGLNVPGIPLEPEPELNGFDKVFEEGDDGLWKQPATFTREDAILALDWMRAYTFRLTHLLAKEPPTFEGPSPQDWGQLDKAGRIFKRLAMKYNGGPLGDK